MHSRRSFRTRINRYDELSAAVGRFVLAYAGAEGFIHVIFRDIARIDKDIARIITGGQRVKDLIPMLKRITDLRGFDDERKDELEKTIAHFNSISILRDKLIHRGAGGNETVFESTNIFTAKAFEDVEILKFNVSHIDNAMADLKKILVRLVIVLKPEQFPKAHYGHYLGPAGSWLYKPPELETPNRLRKKKTR